jgi:2-polyprenyl-3-methyl-5-hydroxy-6-metoxy-1,4-benzoquinol methylase
VGCGSGWYAEHLLGRGAAVTAFDVNSEFVSLTRTRVGESACCEPTWFFIERLLEPQPT